MPDFQDGVQGLHPVLGFRPWPNGDPGPAIYDGIKEELSSAAILERLNPELPGLARYREMLRRITASSNRVLFDVVEDRVHVCRDGASMSAPHDVLARDCEAFVGRLVRSREAYVLGNQDELLASLQPVREPATA